MGKVTMRGENWVWWSGTDCMALVRLRDVPGRHSYLYRHPQKAMNLIWARVCRSLHQGLRKVDPAWEAFNATV